MKRNIFGKIVLLLAAASLTFSVGLFAQDSKLSDLPAVTTPASTDLFLVTQGSASKKETRAQVHALETGEQIVLPLENTPALPSLAWGDGSFGIFAHLDNQVAFGIANVKHAFVNASWIISAESSPQPGLRAVAASATVPNIVPRINATTTGVGSSAVGQLSLIAEAIEGIRLTQSGGAITIDLKGDAVLNDGTTTVDGALQFDRTNEDLSLGDGSASQVVHMGAWKTWTPTFTGFSTDPTINAARYTQVGKLVSVAVNCNNGTSNSTGYTMTLPVAAAGSAKQFGLAAVVTDNGVAQTSPGLLRTNINSTTLDVFQDMANGGWTASGSKKVQFTFTYESN